MVACRHEPIIHRRDDGVNGTVDSVHGVSYRVSMDHVNDRIRQAIRIELARRDAKQSRLAESIGVSRQFLNNVLRGKAGNVPDVWQKILDELDLELVVRPKGDG